MAVINKVLKAMFRYGGAVVVLMVIILIVNALLFLVMGVDISSVVNAIIEPVHCDCLSVHG
ncbi:hypothetical protein DS300_23615 [Salmonella enterica subsp. enterica]|nr:hypothetical protein [Salmonella enterica subsp. enterica serovar Potsdam]EBV2338135.1 hypothetical protein [Salmonella enterica subsp. enterica serovar Potsdam]